MSGETLNIIAPIFLVAGIGFLIEYRGLGFHSETLSRLAMLFGTPSLVFSTLTTANLTNDAIVHVGAMTIVAFVIAAFLSLGILTVLRQPWRTFLPPLSMPNAGNAGLPLVFFAFGEPGLAIGVAYFFVIALIQYTAGTVIASGETRLGKMLREPLIWSVVAVAFFRVTGIEVPRVIADTTGLLSGIMIPIMLILLGGAIARLKIGDVSTSVMLAFVRLVVGVATGFASVTVFNLSGVEAGAFFLLTAMPSALVTYVIAAYYEREPERVAGMVVTSTLLNFACLPILITIAIHMAN